MQPVDPDQHTPEVAAVPTSTENWLKPAPLAPAWHTILLIAALVVLSFAGAKELTGPRAQHVNRLHIYALTVASDLVMLGWVYLGLRLRKVPFRTIFGDASPQSRSIKVDFAAAGIFWMASLFLLGSINLIWMATDAAIHHRALFPNGKPDAQQQHVVDTLSRLAPSHGAEIVVWILLCVMAGITEEVVFRGYLQRQFTAWARGAVAVGVVFSAISFGCAHGYQGPRQMILLSLFGALFSILTLVRRNIRAGIIAHAWQDIFAGLMLSLVRVLHPF